MNNVYVTEKMDGENASIYSDGYIHARSIDGNKHPWQTWLKSYIQTWYRDIPEGWRICGENLYAKHSIEYTFRDESYYFQVFGIYNERNVRLSLEVMLEWCDILNLHFVPIIYEGKYDKDVIMRMFEDYKSANVALRNNETEGFVISNADAFKYEDFSQNVGKYVRANHVTTDAHWSKSWEPNKIKGENNDREKRCFI